MILHIRYLHKQFDQGILVGWIEISSIKTTNTEIRKKILELSPLHEWFNIKEIRKAIFVCGYHVGVIVVS